MRILITGSNGLLGQKIVKQCLAHSIAFLATSKGENRNPDCPIEYYSELDIANPTQIHEVFSSFAPTHVIHTAAITNVDYCETHPEECELINFTSVKLLFEESKIHNAHFQLLSTDFVFDGENGPYKEDDSVGPLSKYAKSKVDAENILLESSYSNTSIVRTIIVYGNAHNLSRSNLVLWAKDALQKQTEIQVVDDQYRSPTWADDLAWACLEICRRKKQGIYHISGPETLSIYGIVERIAQHFEFTMDSVKKVKSSTLNQPAKRPPLTGFDLTKAKNDLGYMPKTIEETLTLLS
jgi:dTDP-4-dehydrorhamnose reductase